MDGIGVFLRSLARDLHAGEGGVVSTQRATLARPRAVPWPAAGAVALPGRTQPPGLAATRAACRARGRTQPPGLARLARLVRLRRDLAVRTAKRAATRGNQKGDGKAARLRLSVFRLLGYAGTRVRDLRSQASSLATLRSGEAPLRYEPTPPKQPHRLRRLEARASLPLKGGRKCLWPEIPEIHGISIGFP